MSARVPPDSGLPFPGLYKMGGKRNLLSRSFSRHFLPLLLLPEATFTQFPLGLTLEGQYIVKNLILIAAAIAVGGTVNSKDTSEEIH